MVIFLLCYYQISTQQTSFCAKYYSEK